MEVLGALWLLIAAGGAAAVAFFAWKQLGAQKRLPPGVGPRALLGQDPDAPLRDLIAKGEKVAAIRAHYASLSSGSMGESKAYVDALAAQMRREQEAQQEAANGPVLDESSVEGGAVPEEKAASTDDGQPATPGNEQ